MAQLIIDIQGTQLSAQDKTNLTNPLTAGVILFSRNYINAQQLCKLTTAIKAIRHDLLICVDQEGGRVQRFKQDFSSLPALANFGKLYQQDKSTALDYTYNCGWLMASELIATGIDLSLAPIVDLDYGRSSVIGNRAFAKDTSTVIALASAYMHGMRAAGMANNIKHFPGHGYVKADSHHQLPIDERSLEQITAQDLIPFAQLIDTNQALSTMAAHVVYKQVDEAPSGFSSVWLRDILRTQLGFKGIIMSDDLSMAGAQWAGEINQRISAATEAGCDLLLVCNNPAYITQALEYMPSNKPVDYSALLAKRASLTDWQNLMQDTKYLAIKQQIESLC
jgi:beta-N-acetylhexosaminidase